MKKKYEAPLCEVREMETNGMLLSASNPSIEITNTDFMEHTSGDVNGNNGWDLW